MRNNEKVMNNIRKTKKRLENKKKKHESELFILCLSDIFERKPHLLEYMQNTDDDLIMIKLYEYFKKKGNIETKLEFEYNNK